MTDIDLAVLIDPNTYRYLNASTVLDNGKFKFNPGKYSTDLVSDRAVEFLGNAIDAQKPFFLGVTPIGPHSETVLGEAGGTKFLAPIPADRHKDLFSCVKVPRGGNFNPDQVCGKMTMSMAARAWRHGPLTPHERHLCSRLYVDHYG